MNEQIKNFILNEYKVNAERPFKEDIDVFRNARNKKWFAVRMKISANKLKLDSEQLVDILNLKNHPENVFMLRGVKGIFPAYHMNKENWLTVLLDGTVSFGMIIDLIDQSYNIIDQKRK